MFYINDKVKEKFDSDDYFNGDEYVKKIKAAIKIDDIKSIGVYGKWGIGKTSIIKNAISELIEENEYSANNVVEYNAWKYSEYDFMRDFLIVCSNKIEGKQAAKEREESYYSDNSEERQLYTLLWKKLCEFLKKSWVVLFIIFIVYIFAIVGILYINYLNPQWYDCADLITPLTLTIISFILPLFLVSEITHKSVSKKFSPEQFARDFHDIVEDKKVLIFIDDIDRCNYEEIKSTFDTLKTFILDENYNVKFIIPVDPNILFSSLENQTYDYFSKIIDYPIEIKNYTIVRYEPLKEDILKNVDEEYKSIVNDGLYLASKFYIDTPRKMKKFSNEFINEIYNYSSEEIKDKGYMFAKLIILKNEFPNYYDSLIRNYDTIMQLTNDRINDYSNTDKEENDRDKYGIVFNSKLLDFLSKTNNVDLYDFPMYEYKITYEEYKIKAICEAPIIKNKFDDNNLIDLNKNEKELSYEFTENVIHPIENNKFLYSDPIRRVCFLVYEFSKQRNNSCFKKLYNELMKYFDMISKDTNLYINENRDGTNVKYLNIKYIIECIEDYLLYLKNKNIDIQEDELINKLLEIICNDLDNTFKYCEEDLFNLTQSMSLDKEINNDSLISIIEKFLISDFNKYSQDMDWYFKYGNKHGKNCFVQNIYELAKIQSDFDKSLYSDYLTKRYSCNSINEYIETINNNISEILQDPLKYSFLIEPIISNLDNSDAKDEVIENLLNNTKLISTDETINKLIISMILKLRKSSSYDSNKIKEILINIGKEYNSTEPIRFELKGLIINCTMNEKKLILDYDEEKNIFNNFNILKEYEVSFDKDDEKIFETLCKTYCFHEEYVVSSDLERHGFNLLIHKDKIKEIINADINSTIYLANDFNEDEINMFKLNELDINELHLDYIDNKYLLSKIINQLKDNIDSCIKMIRANKDDKEIIKEQVNIFLSNVNKLYVDLKYSDKTLWTKLKIIDEYISLNELIDVYYIPTLKEYEGIIKLFETGKYKENYSKKNIVADRILSGIKK